MFKPQMKYSKIIHLVALLFSAVVFFYAVGYATDLYPLYLARAYGKVAGNGLFKEIQPFNKLLVILSIITILCSLLPFVFSTNKRRKYYKENYVTSFIQCGEYVICSMVITIGNIIWKHKFLTTVDLEELAKQAEQRGWFYTGTTIYFDAGFVVAFILLVLVALLINNLLWKRKIMAEEEKILKGELNNG